MPIIVSRTGVPIQVPVLTERQKSQMLDMIVAAYIDANPDRIRAKVAEFQAQALAEKDR